MSFFKDFKEDTQNEENLATLVNPDVEEMNDDLTAVQDIEEVEITEEPVLDDFESENLDEELLGMLIENGVEEKAEKREDRSFSKPVLTQEDKDAVTVITKGTTINGSIISDCSLDVMGTINGDIECLGKLSISGRVTGASMASEIYVSTDRLEGNLNSEGSVKISLGTVIIGDISGTSAVIAGAIKGEVDINGPVVIDSTAIIKGNVKAKSVQMNNGAVLEGFCSLTYASVDIDNVFE